MDNKHLNIVSFTVPFPANYGGVIDVFYKIKSLFELGVKIHLHCFKYDREEAKILKQICESVTYYERNMSPLLLMRKLPFIVESRTSDELIAQLQKNEFPILFEGLHTCGVLQNEALTSRLKLVRSHNIEHNYYKKLSEIERGKAKKIYFKQEARKLEVFEEEVYEKADGVLGISKKDFSYLNNKYGNAKHVSAFHQFNKVEIKSGLGEYAFYHGNLGVGENNEAALYLVEKVFDNLDFPLKIAGNNPSSKLRKLCSKYNHVELLENEGPDEIISLLENAQVNVLPTFQSTGIKLKLLAALYKGRHCLVNQNMVVGTGLDGLCSIANSPAEFKNQIESLRSKEINESTQGYRETELKEFSNDFNAKLILDLI